MMQQLRTSINEHWQLTLLAVILTGSSGIALDGLKGGNSDHEIRITALEQSVADIGHQVKNIDTKLDAILQNQKMEAIAFQYKIRDRWTSSMQMDFQNVWFEIIRDLHPEIERKEIPDIHKIQGKYPEGPLSL